MSIFTLFGPTIKYSQREHPLPTLDLKRLLMQVHIRPGTTVNDHDRDLAFESIEARRGSDGKISLQQIYEVLKKFKDQRALTKIDFQTLMKAFEEYYAGHFSE
ncbi:MAG: hypothetical protein WCT40_01110 [Candidatus Magasanikbacteria bacterium]